MDTSFNDIHAICLWNICEAKYFTTLWHEKLKDMSSFEKVWERVLLVLTHHPTWIISPDGNSLLLFFQEFASIISFIAWFDQFKERGLFFQVYDCLSLLSKHLFLKNQNVQSFLIRKFANKTKICNWCFQFLF